MNLSKSKRIKLFRFARDHRLITLKGQMFLDLCLNRAVWESNLAKTARTVGWGDSHIQELLREMEREGIAESRREGRKVIYKIAEKSLILSKQA